MIASIKANRCILFVGAGLSGKKEEATERIYQVGKVFLEELLSYVVPRERNNSVNLEDIESMITKGNFLMAAQE